MMLIKHHSFFKIMKFKKILIGLNVVLMLFSCGKPDDQTNHPANTLFNFCLELFNLRNFEVKVNYQENLNTILVDGKSFKHIEDGLTIFKYVYSDKYISYR